MSNPIDGNIDCARLQEIKAKAESVFSDDVRRAQFEADAETAKAVLEGQTAQLEEIKNPSKDRTMKLYWFGICRTGDEDTTCTDDCSITGDKLGTECEDVALTECIQSPGFSIDEKELRSSLLTLDELMAQGLLEEMKLMDELINEVIIAGLDAAAGVNEYSGGYTINGTQTEIPAASWTPDLFAYFRQVMRRNNIGKKLNVISGSDALAQSFWIASKNEADVDKRSQIAKMSFFGNPVFDTPAIEDVTGAQATYLYNPGAVAFASKPYWPASGRPITTAGGQQIRSSIPSFAYGRRVIYDLIYQVVCLNNEITHTWALQLHYGFFRNPVGCDNNKTGVLKMVCV